VLVSVLASVDDVQSSTRPEVTCDLSELMSLCGSEVQPGLRGRGSSVTRVELTVTSGRQSWKSLCVSRRAVVEASRAPTV